MQAFATLPATWLLAITTGVTVIAPLNAIEPCLVTVSTFHTDVGQRIKHSKCTIGFNNGEIALCRVYLKPDHMAV